MNILSNEDFAAQVANLVGKPDSDFKPFAYYDADGDCLEFFVSPEDYYGERVDRWVTVYYGQETKQIVGSLLKNVQGLCEEIFKKCPGFRLEIKDGKVRLMHIFLAQLWTSDETSTENEVRIVYEKLAQIAEKSQVEAEHFCLA